MSAKGLGAGADTGGEMGPLKSGQKLSAPNSHLLFDKRVAFESGRFSIRN